MVVMIRLKRTGRRNRACFRLSAIEGRNPRDGRVLENLGLYDPLAPKAEDQLKLHSESVLKWVKQGAQLSETARTLCKRSGIEIPSPSARKPRKRKRNPKKLEVKEQRMRGLSKAKKARASERVAKKKAAAAAAASSDDS